MSTTPRGAEAREEGSSEEADEADSAEARTVSTMMEYTNTGMNRMVVRMKLRSEKKEREATSEATEGEAEETDPTTIGRGLSLRRDSNNRRTSPNPWSEALTSW